MAKIDRNKLLAEAQKYVMDGNLAKAIETYELLCKAFPQDINSYVRLAGLYQRVGKNAEAVRAYARVGEEYTKTGYYQRAIASYKQALGITPKDPDLHYKIGTLFKQIGIKSSAIEHLYQAAQLYFHNGNSSKSEEILRDLVELEPDRIDFKTQYGEVLYQSGKTEEAIHIFRGLIEILKLEQKYDELARFYERILTLNPDDTESAKNLARVYIRLSLPQKAMNILKRIFDKGKVDAELFDLLGRTYVLMGRNDRAVHAFLEMIKHLDPQKDAELIEKTYKRILEIDPTNEEALRALSQKEAPEAFAPLSEGEEEGEVVEVTELPEEEGEEPLSPGGVRAQPEEALKKDEFFNLLQEASVFLRFGVQDKALATLNRILSKNPDHIPALKKRIEILRKHDPNQAVRDLVHLAELYEALGQLAEAEKLIAEAKAINPNHPAIKAHLGLVDFDLSVELAQEEPPSPSIQEEEEAVELEEAGEDLTEEVTVIGGGYAVEQDTQTDPFSQAIAEIGEELGGALSAEGAPSPPQKERTEEIIIGADSDFDAELEQLQFFVDTGLYDEARRLLEDMRNRFGDHPRILKIAADLLQKTGQSPGKPTASSFPSEGVNIEDFIKDLEGELAFLGEVSPGAEDDPPFEEIFHQFKEGVKKQIGDDPLAHYDLGIAYLEMGLVDDAIEEFKISAQSKERFVESREMLAEAYRRKGDFGLAVGALEEALKFPSLTEPAYLNIHYNLGLLYEELGNLKKSLEHFRAVVEKDKQFRDIVDQLKRLKEKVQALKSHKP
jgi:tetratricopeptide (TPR) repeat protein